MSKQLEREIAAALRSGPGATAPARRLTTAQKRRLRVELDKAVRAERKDAYLGRALAHDEYQRAGEAAIRRADVQGRAAAQAGDGGVEIWEVVPGEGAVGDQIAEYHYGDHDDDEDA